MISKGAHKHVDHGEKFMELHVDNTFNTGFLQSFSQHLINLSEDSLSFDDIDFENSFCVGITFGGFPDVATDASHRSYLDFVTTTFSVYNHILTEFKEKQIGYMVEYSDHMITMMGVFPRSEIESFADSYIIPLQNELSSLFDAKICVGIGSRALKQSAVYNSYTTSKYCFCLYFFYQKKWIDFEKLNVSFSTPMEKYDQAREAAFHAILIKDPHALDKIDQAVELLGAIHFGNHLAVRMRTMEFTGYLTDHLQRYQLFQGNLYQKQDALQNQVLNALTFQNIKERIHAYYEDLLPEIYDSGHLPAKVVVEKVKTYIQENFMEELSIQKLSEIAMVSPNYFSHMFKNEVGINYKEYVTQLRMKHALDLVLNSDYDINKIAETVGYQTPRRFTDAFKQTYGDSPTRYKKKLLAQNSTL